MHATAGSLRSPPSQDAGALLGPDHPLTRVEQRMQSLRRQAVAVALLLPASGSALVAGVTAMPVLVAAAVVQAGLLACLAAAAGRRRETALELIAVGRPDLPVAAVQRERARLLDRGHLAGLARSLAALRREVAAPYRDRPLGRPLHDPSTIRQVDGELACVIGVLRRPHPAPAVVACIERLLSSEVSVLYGDDVRLLRDELSRIIFAGGEMRPGAGRPPRP